jgi:hypothetical protein
MATKWFSSSLFYSVIKKVLMPGPHGPRPNLPPLSPLKKRIQEHSTTHLELGRVILPANFFYIIQGSCTKSIHNSLKSKVKEIPKVHHRNFQRYFLAKNIILHDKTPSIPGANTSVTLQPIIILDQLLWCVIPKNCYQPSKLRSSNDIKHHVKDVENT